jgi:hypothetical protein
MLASPGLCLLVLLQHKLAFTIFAGCPSVSFAFDCRNALMKVAPLLAGLCAFVACGVSMGQEPLPLNRALSQLQSSKAPPATAFAVVSPEGTVTLKLLEIEKKKARRLAVRPVYEQKVDPANSTPYTTVRMVLEQEEMEVSSYGIKSMVIFPLGLCFASSGAPSVIGSQAIEKIDNGARSVTDSYAIENINVITASTEVKNKGNPTPFHLTITDVKGRPVTREKVMELLAKEAPVLVSSEPISELYLLTVKDNTLVFVLPSLNLDKPLPSPTHAEPDRIRPAPMNPSQH